MGEREKLERSRAKLRLDMLSGFKDYSIFEIPNDIPTEWTPFEGMVGHYWMLDPDCIDCEDKTVVIYEVPANGVFPTHKHKGFDEHCELLTDNALIEYTTEKGIGYYRYPETFGCHKMYAHALVNFSNFPVKLRVTWSPKMKKGWEAEF